MKVEKQKRIKALWRDLARNTSVTENYKQRNGIRTNVGFINQYALHQSIPNKWFDWENRVDAEIMVIGQDWGPYNALLPYISEYEIEVTKPDFNYDEFLFSTFSSRTEKFIIRAVERSYMERFNRKVSSKIWKNFIFTMGILFTRQGDHFRGKEYYDEKFGMRESLPYLRSQIEIIKPKVIIPLGGVAWRMLREIKSIDKPESISDIVTEQNRKPIESDSLKVVPNFHPASHTDPKVQYDIWKTIWAYV